MQKMASYKKNIEKIWQQAIKRIDIIVFLLIAIAALIEISTLGINRLHMDEALYSNWALHISSGTDALLHRTPTDKFPLISYIISIFLYCLETVTLLNVSPAFWHH
jgi:hypothetical protein